LVKEHVPPLQRELFFVHTPGRGRKPVAHSSNRHHTNGGHARTGRLHLCNWRGTGGFEDDGITRLVGKKTAVKRRQDAQGGKRLCFGHEAVESTARRRFFEEKSETTSQVPNRSKVECRSPDHGFPGGNHRVLRTAWKRCTFKTKTCDKGEGG